MNIAETTLSLFEDEDIKKYLINTFNSFSSDEEIRSALRQRSRREWGWLVGNDKSIGVLDEIEIRLLITILEIENHKKKSERMSWEKREDFYYAGCYRSDKEKRNYENGQKEAFNYQNMLSFISKKITAQLVERIELRFKDAIPQFLEKHKRLKRKTVWHSTKGYILVPGYGFDFDGDNILVVTQCPMSGD